jgi:hypothetical protein
MESMKLHPSLNYDGNYEQAFCCSMLRDRFDTSWMILYDRPIHQRTRGHNETSL